MQNYNKEPKLRLDFGVYWNDSVKISFGLSPTKFSITLSAYCDNVSLSTVVAKPITFIPASFPATTPAIES